MFETNSEMNCVHEVVFAPSLDDAAQCVRCGAIALIAKREPGDGAMRITWIAGSARATEPDRGDERPA